MKEKIYTIPLMDAFRAQDECPFCFIERNLEQHAMVPALPTWKTMSVQRQTK